MLVTNSVYVTVTKSINLNAQFITSNLPTLEPATQVNLLCKRNKNIGKQKNKDSVSN